MSKADVYQSIALPQSQQPEIAQATATAVRRIYEAQLRKIAIRLGFGDPGKVVLTNKPILTKIQQHGQKVGTAVVNVTNRMAQNQLKNLSDDLSDPQLLDKLGPWMKAAELHNQRVIIPFNARYAQQQAERDFVQNNPGITQSWRVDPAETPSNDVCREAIDLGEVGDEIMSDPIYEFPAHPNCFVAGTVISGPLVHTAFSRPYQGPIITIRTAGGNELTGTPNHPILTPEGWIGLGSLQEGQHVYRSVDTERMATFIGPDEYHIPSLIEQVLGAGVVSFSQMPSSAQDFHGDGMVDSYVDVVATDGLLQRRTRRFGDHPGKITSRVTAIRQRLLHSSRSLAQISVSARSAAYCIVRGTRDLLPLFDRHLGHALLVSQAVSDSFFRTIESKPLRFVVGTKWDARPAQTASESPVVDADLLRQRMRGFSGLVALDEVIEVRNVDTICHVYNASTTQGWYVANNIIVSNCPHMWVPVDSDISESTDEAWLGGSVNTKTAPKVTTVRSFEEMLEESLTTSMRAYNPDQPRDQDGKWSGGGSGASGGSGATHVKGPSDNPRQKGRGLETTKGGGKAVVGGAVEEGHNAAAQLVHANMGTGYAAKGKIEGTALPHVEGLIDAGKGAHYVAWPNHTTGTNGASGYPRYQTGEDMAGEVQAMKGEIKDIRKTIKGARSTQFGAVDPKTGLSPGHLQLQGIGDRITNAATTLNHYAPESMPPNHPFVQSMRQHLRQAAHGDFTDNAQVRLDSYQSSLIPLEQARRLQEHAIRRHVTSGKPLIGKTGVVSIKGDTRYMGVNEGAAGGSAT